jgi:hypothetical protein
VPIREQFSIERDEKYNNLFQKDGSFGTYRVSEGSGVIEYINKTPVHVRSVEIYPLD